ncbi:MAG: Anthranilate synthase [Candidatus Peregrinibacteria bacterium GW2011_GWE2_39_6]|nr:MAG: Anthranilate synthase [Candidatus Peregrinibacteria bacterium GW2011_GWF2_39_17]KKR26602.1 MAG: Anthranilate synthase [Candidatus Peregrinibacteria bacterium GW2011_GWE2_39_6]HCW32494.1 anthranilate synthase component I [Candidatus Peregrinibacteria bacterium]
MSHPIPAPNFNPVQAYQQLCHFISKKSSKPIPSFLLHSGRKTSQTGRYSILGYGAKREWRATNPDSGLIMLKKIQQFLKNNHQTFNSSLPPFLGGAVGYLSYDFGTKTAKTPLPDNNDFPTPYLHFIIPKNILVYDHLKKNLYTSENFNFTLLKPPTQKANSFQATLPHPDLSPKEYLSKINLVHQFLRQGETYEVNFAQRFQANFQGDPFTLYSRLAQLNPSPYACYLNFYPITVVSCSPECLIRGQFQKDKSMLIDTRPIKGTIAKEKTPTKNQKAIQNLLSSQKDEAELNMIVDLARNDLGKICKTGSVKVTQHRILESYSHVHHTMSNVQGILKKKLDWLDVLKAVFPGGSITGAPKKRTMEIITKLEPCRRGVYTGSAGYISFNGQFEFNILIRTIAVNRKSQRLSYHAGGAIVVDSKAEEEYQETLDKAAALFEAIKQTK